MRIIIRVRSILMTFRAGTLLMTLRARKLTF